MPIYDYLCLDCGATNEILVTGSQEMPKCSACQSENMKKLMSATSGLTGTTRQSMPGPGDTSCCGSNPSHAGCAGPGSCCGKSFA